MASHQLLLKDRKVSVSLEQPLKCFFSVVPQLSIVNQVRSPSRFHFLLLLVYINSIENIELHVRPLNNLVDDTCLFYLGTPL